MDLVCETKNRYVVLTFQILPNSVMGGKPPLLSGADSEMLGLINFQDKDVFATTSSCQVLEASDTEPPGYRIIVTDKFSSKGYDVDKPITPICNHAEEIHATAVESTCKPPPQPSLPLHIPSSRKLPPPGELTQHDLLTQYSENFEGIGNLGPPIHFKVNTDVTPVQMPVHRVPVAKRAKEKEALQKYEDAGIIVKVNEPTPWCPTPSKTPNAQGEGNTHAEAERDHDRRIVALMERCIAKNIKLNPNKLKFKMKDTLFMGHVISDTGMRPDPDKVSAITQMEKPRNKAAVLRFIGMCNYLSEYCPNLSSIIKPLRMLTQDGSEHIWSEVQEQAFNEAKRIISSAPTLTFYDLHRPVTCGCE